MTALHDGPPPRESPKSPAPTDADPAPVAQVSVTGDAVIRAHYTPKAPTLISVWSALPLTLPMAGEAVW
jgi:hypothetical protein